MLLAANRSHMARMKKRPQGTPGKQEVKDMQSTNIIAKSFSLVVLGVIAAITLVMAFAPAASIYNG